LITFAWLRHVRHIGPVGVINGLLGWTVIGWVVAPAMAYRSRPRPAVVAIQRVAMPPPGQQVPPPGF
jgi:Superinfection immunity protein